MAELAAAELPEPTDPPLTTCPDCGAQLGGWRILAHLPDGGHDLVQLRAGFTVTSDGEAVERVEWIET